MYLCLFVWGQLYISAVLQLQQPSKRYCPLAESYAAVTGICVALSQITTMYVAKHVPYGWLQFVGVICMYTEHASFIASYRKHFSEFTSFSLFFLSFVPWPVDDGVLCVLHGSPSSIIYKRVRLINVHRTYNGKF